MKPGREAPTDRERQQRIRRLEVLTAALGVAQRKRALAAEYRTRGRVPRRIVDDMGGG